MLNMASSDEDESLAASIGIGGSGGGASTGGTSAANAAAAAATIATVGANVAGGANHLGHESAEEEGLYHFRRSKISQYHKVT